MSVRIVQLYQALLGIYGDQGNARVLQQRLRMRGIDADVTEVRPGDAVPAGADVYLLGGGEDQAQVAAVSLLRDDTTLRDSLADGSVLFAVCAGYQICGNSFTVGADDQVVEGLGLLDVDTRRGEPRAVGEIVTDWTRPDGSVHRLTGFENHGGFTRVNSGSTPLARVVTGVGNGHDGSEGAVAPGGHVIGTYLHGPVLARNPELADHLLTSALGRDLEPLELPEIEQLRAARFRVAAHEASGR